MILTSAAREVILALADDEACMGHRHSEWVGVAPFLEEDLAIMSIGQDELGHARLLYLLITAEVDHLALLRPPEQYRCAWMVEQPASDYADALVRHLLYDTAEGVRWRALVQSSVTPLAELAHQVERDEAFHVAHAVAMTERLLDSTDEAATRIRAALDRWFPLGAGLFEPTASDAEAVAEGVVAASSAALLDEWRHEVAVRLAPFGIAVPVATAALPGGRRGVRSPYFAALHADMTAVFALDPSASW